MTKIILITTGLCWIYFIIVRWKSIKEYIKGEAELWDDVIFDTLHGWMLFFFAFAGTNILFIKWLYEIL